MTYEERMLLGCLLVVFAFGLLGWIGRADRAAMDSCLQEFSRPVCERTLN